MKQQPKNCYIVDLAERRYSLRTPRAFRWLLAAALCTALAGLAGAQTNPTPAAAGSQPTVATATVPLKSTNERTSVAAPVDAQRTTLSLDNDLISFTKWTISIGGLFLVAVSFIGVMFFGWDVRQTRQVMLDARADISNRLEAIRADHLAIQELKDKVAKLRAELEDQVAKGKPPSQPADSEATDNQNPTTKSAPTSPTDDATRRRLRLRNFARLRDVLQETPLYTWRTLGTLERKTGLTREEILEAVKHSGGRISISLGEASGELILQLKKPDAPSRVEQHNSLLAAFQEIDGSVAQRNAEAIAQEVMAARKYIGKTKISG